SLVGNNGTGLGRDFAASLNRNLKTVFSTFGDERVTRGTHLEKLALIHDGVGRDNVSDFTTNLIKDYLLTYTQEFAKRHLSPQQLGRFTVSKAKFDYETETWRSGTFELPSLGSDFVLLTPKDMLTREETWINRSDLLHSLTDIAEALPNEQLRAQL